MFLSKKTVLLTQSVLFASVFFIFVLGPSGSLFAAAGDGPIESLSKAERQNLFQQVFTKIRVVDSETGRGIPMAEVERHKKYYTDSHGIIALWEPGVDAHLDQAISEDERVDFWLEIAGYQPPVGFGISGFNANLEPGNTKIVKVTRTMIAERLYRFTGQGIYEDSFLVGEDIPIDEPLLNAQTVVGGLTSSAVFNGKIYWFIAGGRTPDKAYGHFNTSGATSELPDTGLSPVKGVNLNYFVNTSGAAKPLLNVSVGGGPLAVMRVMVLDHENAEDEMFVYYVRLTASDLDYKNELDLSPFLNESAHGIAKWSSSEKRFVTQVNFDLEKPYDVGDVIAPYHNTFKVKENGQTWFYFANPYPTLRVPAAESDILNSSSYEVFTPLDTGASWGGSSPPLTRDSKGQVVWGWKTLTSPVTDLREAALEDSGTLEASEGIHHLRSMQTGDSVDVLGGSIYWNPYREKWVMIGTELRGSNSNLGEIWYAEADSPLGPWVYSVKVATHNKRILLGTSQVPFFDESNGETIYFHGTLSEDFQHNSKFRVSHYENNQMMYRVDVSDSRLYLPTPIYRGKRSDGWHHYRSGKSAQNSGQGSSTIPFYAWPKDRARDGAQPVWEVEKQVNGVKVTELTTDSTQATSSSPVFYTPAQNQYDTDPIVALHEYTKVDGEEVIYRTEFQPDPEGFTKTSSSPVAFVWGSPRLDPPRNPGAQPVVECKGGSAHCP